MADPYWPLARSYWPLARALRHGSRSGSCKFTMGAVRQTPSRSPFKQICIFGKPHKQHAWAPPRDTADPQDPIEPFWDLGHFGSQSPKLRFGSILDPFGAAFCALRRLLGRLRPILEAKLASKSDLRSTKNRTQNPSDFRSSSEAHSGAILARFGSQKCSQMGPSWPPKGTPKAKSKNMKKIAPAAAGA